MSAVSLVPCVSSGRANRCCSAMLVSGAVSMMRRSYFTRDLRLEVPDFVNLRDIMRNSAEPSGHRPLKDELGNYVSIFLTSTK